MRNNGRAMIKAAIKIKIPTVVFKNPPTRGIKPKRLVMGEKKSQIPTTIIK